MAFSCYDDDEDFFGTAVFAGGFIGAMEELTEAERRRERASYGYIGYDVDDDDEDASVSGFLW